MTEKPNLAEIERELGEIQPWPWEVSQVKGFGAKNWLWASEERRWAPIGELECGRDTEQFIAKSPERIRALLDMVKELQTKIDTHAQALREAEARGMEEAAEMLEAKIDSNTSSFIYGESAKEFRTYAQRIREGKDG